MTTLAAVVATTVFAEDKYSLKSPSGIAPSDFSGYEDWSMASSALADGVLKVIPPAREARLQNQESKPEGGSCDCHYLYRAICGNHRGHQAKSETIEHSFDDVDNRGWFRTSDILHVRGRAGGRNVFLRDEV